MLKKRKEYAEAKTALKDKNIRFQTPFPARLRVHYPEGTVLYGSPEEATEDMAKRGFPVTVIKRPESLLEQIQEFTWRTNKKPRSRKTASKERSYVKKLKDFRRQDPA